MILETTCRPFPPSPQSLGPRLHPSPRHSRAPRPGRRLRGTDALDATSDRTRGSDEHNINLILNGRLDGHLREFKKNHLNIKAVRVHVLFLKDDLLAEVFLHALPAAGSVAQPEILKLLPDGIPFDQPVCGEPDEEPHYLLLVSPPIWSLH